MEFHFILYRPATPGNVGAAARAIKTMGFRSLRLIEPCDHLADEARMMAHGSLDILEKATLFASFREATSDLDLLACTTARERTAKHEYHTCREFHDLLEDKQDSLDQVGILFGTEESGLPNELVLRSQVAVTIPMAAGYPSLNLAQAVMVTAYELSFLNTLSRPGRTLTKSGEGWGTLKYQARELLLQAGIPEGSPLHHRIMERLARVEPVDIPLFLSVLKGLRA